MVSGGSDRDAEYALSKLLQMGTVAEYESKFVVLANRVTWISESLLTSFYISGLKLDLQCLLLRSNPKTLEEAFSLTRAAKTRFTNLDIWEFLRSNPLTLGEDFFKARITEVDDLVDEDNDSEVEEVYDETTTYMSSTGFNVNKASKSGSGGGNKSLYEQRKENHGEDLYDDDDFDDPGLQMLK
ncbi:hypothetical protein Tco_1029539 [Tanacetum coccineum]|uniref:Retrotransposon gag domain-containing protein n=1 Tax=Tanacetum coccineum TaxID=301880 RepID=A0ABQ5G598_9ASTR